jgi:hypothetical protein
MTKEELKQEARKDADSVSGFDLQTSVIVAKDKNHAYRLGRYDGYLSGAEPREKRIEELEQQIEKMKSCTNCINNYFLATEEPCCSCTRCYVRTTKKTTDKWEIKENDL